MIIITGGAFQGKLEFAKSLVDTKAPVIAEGENLNEQTIENVDIINGFHLYIKRCLSEGKDVPLEVQTLIEKNPNVIITITELGCGIVPIDAFDRLFRETTGRISCQLAKQADAVYRVSCGIGMKIK